MTENDILQQLRDMRYPHDIDVADAVMARLSKSPILAPAKTKTVCFQRVAAAVAACAVLAVSVNVALLFFHDYNEQSIGSMISEVYDYHADYDNLTASLSDYDVSSIESFYEDQYFE